MQVQPSNPTAHPVSLLPVCLAILRLICTSTCLAEADGKTGLLWHAERHRRFHDNWPGQFALHVIDVAEHNRPQDSPARGAFQRKRKWA